jgi:hypothetical protein
MLQAFLPDRSGIVKLVGGTISSPVAYIDLTLPAGFSRFRLALVGFNFSVDAFVAFVLSQDSGVTFINDPVQYDSYRHTYIAVSENTPNVVGGLTFVDANIDIGAQKVESTNGFGINIVAEIFPGSSSQLASFLGNTFEFNLVAKFAFTYGAAAVNPTATIPPTLGRTNLIRILPYGVGDSNPPTSGVNIVAGSYLLEGFE